MPGLAQKNICLMPFHTNVAKTQKPVGTGKTFVISAPPQKTVLKQIDSLREQLENLNDYLDLLEARARNRGKPTFTTDQVRKQLGLA